MSGSILEGRMGRRGGSLVLAGLLGACGGEAPEALDEGELAPLTSLHGTRDAADTGCHVVLRSLGRVADGRGGFETQGSSWAFVAEVDVAREASSAGANLRVLYRSSLDQRWREASGSTSGDGAPGFVRSAVRLGEGLPGPGLSGTALSRAWVEVIPFLALAEGGRLFDHNRIPNPLTNYLVRASDNFAVPADLSTCARRTSAAPAFAPPAVRLAFAGDWTSSASGALWEGGEVAIDFELARLGRCYRRDDASFEAFAHVRALPSGRVVSGSIRRIANGRVEPQRFTAPIPAGSTHLEVWFEGRGDQGRCRSWDSDHGRNYRFVVRPQPEWMGRLTANISRSGGAPCASASEGAIEGQFDYGTWARSRAVVGNVCFEVYRRGLTDGAASALWQSLDARAYYRFDPAGPWQWAHVPLVDRVGNNARYAFDVRALDPFRPHRCPEGPVTTVSGAGPSEVEARLELYFVVNGRVLGGPGGAPLLGLYRDYPNDPWRAENCR